MDNIIEIIVFFFVIYSILGSIFGKKKTQQKKNQQQYKRPVPQQRRTTTRRAPSQQSSQDILEELFGFKIPKPEENTGYSTTNQADNLEYSSWDPEKDFQKKVEQRQNYEYRSIEKEVPDVNYDKIATLETAKRKVKISDPIVQKNKKEIFKKTIEIKQKLREPRTVRELFLISEILSKPRALRKIR
jgi:hypothetical protein